MKRKLLLLTLFSLAIMVAIFGVKELMANDYYKSDMVSKAYLFNDGSQYLYCYYT